MPAKGEQNVEPISSPPNLPQPLPKMETSSSEKCTTTEETNREVPTLRLMQEGAATNDFVVGTDGNFSFKTDDVSEIINDRKGDRWKARSKTATKERYLSSSFVIGLGKLKSRILDLVKVKSGDIDGISPENKHGASFISFIQDSETRRNSESRLSQGNVEPNICMFQNTEEVDYTYSEAVYVNCRELRSGIEQPITFGLSNCIKYQWEIPKSLITLIRRIRARRFHEEWEGLWNNTTPVAIKRLVPGTVDPTDFLMEAHILKKLKHDKIIQLYAVCTQNDSLYIITEFMENGSLLEFLHGTCKNLKMPKLINIAAQVASGMAYLEIESYIHRDVAARNILVGENNSVKIANFGLAKEIMEDVYEAGTRDLVPIRWTAPEVINNGLYSIKSDVWSFGILLMEIVTYGQIPYPDMKNDEVLKRIVSGYRMPCPPGCLKPLYEIMMKCWRKDEKTRPTFETLQWQLEDFYFINPEENI